MIENPPSDFEPKFFETEFLVSGKKGKLLVNDRISFVVKKTNYLFLSSVLLLLIGISTSISTRHFTFLFPVVVIMFILSSILLIISLVRTRKEEITIAPNEIKSIKLVPYEAGLLKIRRSLIHIKTASKDIWIQTNNEKTNEELYSILKSKVRSESV